MRTRFHAEPIVQATELLLQERTHATSPIAIRGPKKSAPAPRSTTSSRRRAPPAQSARRQPSTHLLSNGRYSVMLTAAARATAAGRACRDALARGHDARRLGSYVFLRTSTVAKCGRRPTSHAAHGRGLQRDVAEDRAEFVRYDGPLRRPSTSWSRRRTTPRSVDGLSPMPAVRRVTSRSPPTPNRAAPHWPMQRTRPSPRCSYRRIAASAPSCRSRRRSGPDEPSCGPPISRSSKAKRSVTSR